MGIPHHICRDGYTSSANSARLLSKLAGYSDRVELRGDRVVVRELIETPYTEHSIVDKYELFRRILGSVAAEWHWEGSYTGPHHIMWPKEFYRKKIDGEQLAMRFRSCASLRIILPRELHDYTHKITEPPKLPDVEVMRQYCHEQRQVQILYDIVRYHGLAQFPHMAHEAKEAYRLERFRERLEHMDDGLLGVMPSRELLAILPLHEARQTVRSIARVQGLSNDSACRAAFFAGDTARLVA